LVSYPCLTEHQQQYLPKLFQAIALPVMYEDSTNRLWQCDTVDGLMILKVCDSHNVASSAFWQGMKALFAIDLPSQMNQFDHVYSEISATTSLTIPDYTASASAVENESSPAFILASLLPGSMLEPVEVDDGMVADLAEHISALHQQQRSTSGAIYATGSDASQWLNRLKESLVLLAEYHSDSVPSDLLHEVFAELVQCTVDHFVPIMPDLRWDQFLQQDGKLSALVDLDAIVYGPRELELVLLEFLLDQQQAMIFKEKYQQSHSLPDLTKVRKAYRLLLFMMNVLGEKNVDAWMQAPTRF